MKVKVYSHGFFCYPVSETDRRAVADFSKKLAHIESQRDARTGEVKESVKAIYAAWQVDHSEFGFLKKCLPAFKEFMGGKWRKELELQTMPDVVPVPMTVKMDSMFQPRGEQPEALKYTITDGEASRTLECATGFGKTILGHFTMEHKSVRTVAVMEPTHIATWVKAAEDYMGLGPGDVTVVKGSSSLKAIMQLALLGELDTKFILVSGTTMRNYIKAYEAQAEEGFDYPVKPIDLWTVLRVGFMIRDEVHEAIHSTVRQVIYSHVPCIMYLSATLVSDDEFINTVYNLIYGDKDERWKSKNNNHICMRPVIHTMDSELLYGGKFKFMGPRGYSHVKYEQSIMKKKSLLMPYMGFVNQMLRSTLIKHYADGKDQLKGLVLCSTKEMCWKMQAYLQELYPDKTIGCFVDGAPKEELYERDIIVSTSKGAGTGKDIPGLFVVIQTIALGSVQLGLQIMGRLREVKAYPGLDPIYIYFVNDKIRAHTKYHQKRLGDTKGKIKDSKNIITGFKLGGKVNKLQRQKLKPAT